MRWVLVSAVGAVMVTGCVASPDRSDSPSPTAPVASTPAASPTRSLVPSPSPTAVASYPADLPTGDPASAAIIAGWQEYWRVYEKFAADPAVMTDSSELAGIADGEELEVLVAAFAQARDLEMRVIGPQQFRDIVVGPITVSDMGHQQTMISYCADTSSRERFSTRTGERIEVDAPSTFTEQAAMERGTDEAWRVIEIRNQEGQC